jgi:hypothetical protein
VGALCAEVVKARISLREGRLIEMPMALVANGPGPDMTRTQPVPSTIQAQSLEVHGMKWRSGRDLKTRAMTRRGTLCAAVACAA